jgi:hypothetical protein
VNNTSASLPVASARVNGAVALISGGAQGRLRYASRFVDEGAEDLIGDINVERAQAPVAAITARGEAASAIEMDVADAYLLRLLE